LFLCAELQVFAWLSCLILVCTAGAQRGTSGSIEGAMTDVQGGAISGAKLTAVNSDTGLKLESVSDENGFFHFPVVPPGTYVLQLGVLVSPTTPFASLCLWALP